LDITKAIYVFEFDGLEDVTKDNITKKYRQLMKVNHPDIGGDSNRAIEINEAKDVLTEVLEQIDHLNKLRELSNRQSIMSIIPLIELVNIYKGKNIELNVGDDTFILNRKNIRSNEIILDIFCTIQIDGIDYKFNTLSKLNLKDEYSIICKITDKNIQDDRRVNIKAYGKDVNLNVRGLASSMILNFDGLVKLKVIVERRVVEDGQ